MTDKKFLKKVKTPAQALLDLAGSWADLRIAEEIMMELKQSRRNSSDDPPDFMEGDGEGS